MKKILLDDRTEMGNNVIAELSQSYENGKKMLLLMQAIGIDKSEINDWSEIENLCKENFPKATLQFNIEANGIEKKYREAEEFFRKHKGALTYEPMSEEEKEKIREEIRIYATTKKQLEARALILQTIDNFNRLQELGARLDYESSYLLHKVFSYDGRTTPKMKPSKSHLINLITELK